MTTVESILLAMSCIQTIVILVTAIAVVSLVNRRPKDEPKEDDEIEEVWWRSIK